MRIASCLTIIVTVTGSLLQGGCTGQGDSVGGHIARQRAYPRVTLCDTIYTDRSLPAGFLVNAQAEIADVTPPGQSTRVRWIDVNYPAYDATLHCTFTPVDGDEQRNAVVANRMERMMLNIGDNFAEQTELVSAGGFSSTILQTSTRVPTPVQFLSVGQSWVVSGALQFNADFVDTDSVMPILQAVVGDLIYASKNL